MTTISDVATMAGVSTATVSRFLNGDAVRAGDRIRAAIETLDFRPNATARSLKSGRTGVIGIVVPDVTNPYFAAVVKGAEAISRQHDYSVYLTNTEEDTRHEQAVVDAMLGRVDGVILAPATEDDPTPLAVRASGIPAVLLDRATEDDAVFDTVLVDNEGGGRQAAEHLLGLGHERIAMISGPLNTTPGRLRHAGFLAALQAAGVELAPDCLILGDFRRHGGYQAALRLLAMKRPPTAVFVANNLMTMGALHAIRDLGFDIPADISVVGFDDFDLADLLTPPLTVIDRPMEDQGVLAMRLLLSRLGGDADARPRRIVMDTRLVIRGSCGGPTVRRT